MRDRISFGAFFCLSLLLGFVVFCGYSWVLKALALRISLGLSLFLSSCAVMTVSNFDTSPIVIVPSSYHCTTSQQCRSHDLFIVFFISLFNVLFVVFSFFDFFFFPLPLNFSLIMCRDHAYYFLHLQFSFFFAFVFLYCCVIFILAVHKQKTLLVLRITGYDNFSENEKRLV